MLEHELQVIRDRIRNEVIQEFTEYKFIPSHRCGVHRSIKCNTLQKHLTKLIFSFDDTKRVIFEENKDIFIERTARKRSRDIVSAFRLVVSSFLDSYDFDKVEIIRAIGGCCDPSCIESVPEGITPEDSCGYVSRLGIAMSQICNDKRVKRSLENLLSVFTNAFVTLHEFLDERFEHVEYYIDTTRR